MIEEINIEERHKKSIDKLIEEFGEEKRDEIESLYNSKRKRLEKDAKILSHTPIFVYREIRDIFKQQ